MKKKLVVLLLLLPLTVFAQTFLPPGGPSNNSIVPFPVTNAAVVACGAVLTCDITITSIPAKAIVRNVFYQHDTAGAGPTTLTVQCGDSVAAGTFNTFVVVSNLLAATTTYGDTAAERGTNALYHYMPSYTASSNLVCRFISTVANLNAVTGLSGRVIVELVYLP